MNSRFLLVLLVLLPLAAHANRPSSAVAPVEGVDYQVIADGKPFAPLNGKVEVVEVFGYTCIHCARFQPQIDAWKQQQPADVRFTAVPAAFGGLWIPYARAYLAAQKLGLLGKTHSAMFKALHEDRSLPIQNASTQEIAAFYAGYGADAKVFAATMEGAEVDAQLAGARQFAVASGVEGTPSMIVNGKYRVTARDFTAALRTTDYLVARERARRR
ncbi:MAG: thiol:disulfide interchange protein DsbA/DsbL [Pseudoxanthomonas sp.]|nr:thiol:disulfide interchange protein DsbA/DsbL [Pseudoxanthomonas sp.]